MLILTTFLISSCSSVKKLDILTKEVERVPLNLEKPTPIKMEELKWVIITSENAEEVFKKLQDSGADPVLFGLTDDGYETLSKNFAQIRAYIIKQNQIIDEYQDYYEPSDNKTKE